MMTRAQRKWVWGFILVTYLFVGLISEVIRPGHAEYMRALKVEMPGDYKNQEGRGSFLGDSQFQTLLPTLLGVREVLASLMWVQADDYFHRGEYRPIIRMVKQITAIDPHQLDVYATGAWHMAYNFMDKRLIADGVEFLEEGSKNNDAVYDLYFELGYMHYDKTKDYPKAVNAYHQASERGTTTGTKIPPAYVRHQLAHAYEKMGDIDTAIKQWDTNLKIAREQEAAGAKYGPAGPNTAAAKHNLYMTERRRNERLAAVAERAGDPAEALRLWEQNVALADAWLKEAPTHKNVLTDRNAAVLQVDRLKGGKLSPQEPVDLNFKFTLTRIKPRQIEVDGTCDVLNLARVNVMFRDKGYEELAKRGFDYKMNNLSLEWENVSIKGGKFKFLINLDRDPADMGRAPSEIYPLKSPEYEVVLTFNPRLQAAFIQDRYGWSGEGLTAKGEMLETDESRAGMMEGKRYPLRYVTKKVTLKREDVLGQGKQVLYKG